MNTPLAGNDPGEQATPILHNLALFGEVLRGLGLEVGSGNMVDLVRATEHVPLARRGDFRQAARSILVHRKADLPLFDEAFDVFWRRPATGQTSLDLRSMGEQRRFRQPQAGPPAASDPAGAGASGQADDENAPDQVDLTRTYSPREVLREKNFARFTMQEVEEAKGMIAQLSWNLGRRQTRRREPGSGAQLDLRRTLRANQKYGGELLDLSYRRRRDKPRSLVLLCDISGSMERYTRMLLHFIHAISGGLDRVEAFLFATRLTRITRYLQHRGVDQTVSQVSRAVPDWAGGTRIGDALKSFNYLWLRRVVRGGAVVMVISDGWDRGRAGAAIQGNVSPATQLQPFDLVEPAAGRPSLPTPNPGDAGRVAVHRRFPAGTQPEQPGSAGPAFEQFATTARGGTTTPRGKPAGDCRRNRGAGSTGNAPQRPRARQPPHVPPPLVGAESVTIAPTAGMPGPHPADTLPFNSTGGGAILNIADESREHRAINWPAAANLFWN